MGSILACGLHSVTGTPRGADPTGRRVGPVTGAGPPEDGFVATGRSTVRTCGRITVTLGTAQPAQVPPPLHGHGQPVGHSACGTYWVTCTGTNLGRVGTGAGTAPVLACT